MKILLTIILTTIVILFALQNFEHVPIYFFGGKPVHVRLFFVMAVCGIMGYLIRFIVGIAKEEEIKKKYRHLRLQEKKRQQQSNLVQDYDEI